MQNNFPQITLYVLSGKQVYTLLILISLKITESPLHQENIVLEIGNEITTVVKNKEDKINKGEHRSKNATPTTFNNRKHLKEWVKIPIPKQIEDEEHDMQQT